MSKDEEDFSSAAAFPQRSIVDGPPGTSNPTTEATQRQDGPNFFRDSENVQFNWSKDLVRFDANKSHATLHLSTFGQLHRTTQTHATVMHQFLEQPEVSGDLTCRISFPTEHIFRVCFARTTEELGAIGELETLPAHQRMVPHELSAVPFETEERDGFVAFSTAAIEVRAYRTPFNLQAHFKRCKVPFWSQRRSDLFTSDITPTSVVEHKGRKGVFDAFNLRSGDRVFGLGERFDSVDRRGRKVDFVNHDAIGTSNTRTYINVPFFWSTAGWGCFVNHTARTEFDIAASEQGTVGFGVEENYLDYFVIAGPKPKDIIRRYTQDLTGVAPILPVWTFGLWLSRNSYQSWDVVDQIIKKCNDLKIPVDTLHLDTFWFKQNWNPDYIFDEKRFANPEKKMAAYKKEGIHISLWSYNCAPPRQDNSVFAEGVKGGYFATQGPNNKELYQFPEGTRGTWTDDATIDFSNSEAVKWYTAKMRRLVEQGASAIKTDFGDCVPPHAHYQRVAGRRFQNHYALAYTSSISTAIKEADSKSIIWARPGTAGSQRYPVHWGGDSQCSWSGLQGTLKSSLSIGVSGFSYHSHDIGGFIGKPSPELYVRWAQLGLFSSHSRSHGAGDENGREPWYFGDEAVEIFRKYASLRYQLLPYIVEQARLGSSMGLPLVRAMILEFPECRSSWDCEEQYLFGEYLLVAPILESSATTNEKLVYLPKGTWFDFWTKEKRVSSGEWITLTDTPLDRLPVWVRQGALLAFAEPRLRTHDEVGKIERVELYGVPKDVQTMSHGVGPTYFEVDVKNQKVKDGSKIASKGAQVHGF